MNSGVHFVASGEKFLAEAIENAKYSRQFTGSLPISISTNLVQTAESSRAFDFVINHPSPSFSYRDKIVALLRLPYRQTLYLDSDAIVISPITRLFQLLDHYDVAGVAAPVRHPPGWSDGLVPRSFTEINTGVLLLKRCRLQRRLISRWLRLYDKLLEDHNQSWDQASFRSVLWNFIQQKNLQFCHLPPEINLRTPKPWIAGRGMDVNIIHGRFVRNELDAFVSYLNTSINRFRTSDEWLRLNPSTSIRPMFDNPTS